jgi:SynChlorMet cassette protein ScmC
MARMKYPMPINTEHVAQLALADGSIWNIVAADERAYDVISALAKVMHLQSPEKINRNKSHYSAPRRLIVHVEDPNRDSEQINTTAYFTVKDHDIICALISKENIEMPVAQLMNLSMVICRDSQCRGGVLLHGALAGWNGNGVILAGPTGRGKTTASRRLPYHWQSFCDDTTLVVCDNKGAYWAHPWPTWSAFMFNGLGSTWNVQHAVPLKGIFFLEQAHDDVLEPIGIAQSICLLNESAEQAHCFISMHSEKNEMRQIRLLRFDNICALAKVIPSYVLRLGHEGAFWKEIERALNG